MSICGLDECNFGCQYDCYYEKERKAQSKSRKPDPDYALEDRRERESLSKIEVQEGTNGK